MHVPPCYYLFLTEVFNASELLDKLSSDLKEVFGPRIFHPENLRIEHIPQQYSKSSKLILGEYDPLRKLIKLYDKACRKTAIHELLHASSFFTQTPELYELYKREKHFIEGFTEFFAGYVLFIKCEECYKKWIKEFYICSLSYKQYVRIFGAVAQIYIPILDLAKIYLYDPHTNWLDIYKCFLSNYYLKDFLLEKPKKKIPSDTLFLDSIKHNIQKNYGSEKVDEFKELLYEAPLSTVLDYSTMLK